MVGLLLFQILLLGISGSQGRDCNCEPCKYIPDGQYNGSWNLMEKNSSHCPGVLPNDPNGCLYFIKSDDGNVKEMCFCDPGQYMYNLDCNPPGSADAIERNNVTLTNNMDTVIISGEITVSPKFGCTSHGISNLDPLNNITFGKNTLCTVTKITSKIDGGECTPYIRSITGRRETTFFVKRTPNGCPGEACLVCYEGQNNCCDGMA